MSDEVTTTTPADSTSTEAQAATTATVTPPADATGTNSGTSDRTFTQADLDRIIKDRLEQERTKSQKEAAKAQADAEAKVLAEQGKYKELFEKQQAELETERSARRDSELKLLRQQAAAQTTLPAALADRLKGETLEEMVNDAKAILAALPKPAAPNVNASNGDGAVPKGGQLSDDKKQQLADRFGVKANLIQ